MNRWRDLMNTKKRTNREVMLAVLGPVQDDQIFRSIILLVAIDVMHDFICRQFSTKKLFCNQTMLSRILACLCNLNIRAPCIYIFRLSIWVCCFCVTSLPFFSNLVNSFLTSLFSLPWGFRPSPPGKMITHPKIHNPGRLEIKKVREILNGHSLLIKEVFKLVHWNATFSHVNMYNMNSAPRQAVCTRA